MTTIMLIFPSSEDGNARMREVLNFKIRDIDIVFMPAGSAIIGHQPLNFDVTSNVFGNIYIGSFNFIDVKSFLNHICNNVNWEDAEYVQLLIKSEDEWTYNVYTHAGKFKVHSAIHQ